MVFVTPLEVAPGVNPFPPLIAALDRFAYAEPTPGLGIRLGVLLAMTAAAMLACVIYLGLHWLTHRRTPNRGSFWWVFKTARHQNGCWILVNLKLLIPAKSLVDLALAFVFVINGGDVYLNHAPQHWIGGLRIAFTAAYLIMPNSYRAFFLTPTLVNSFYFGLAVPSAIAHIGMVIYEGLLYSRAYTLYSKAMVELEVLAATWSAGVDTTLGREAFLTGTFAKMGKAYDRYQTLSAPSYMLLFLGCSLIFFLNSSYLSLLFIVRRQIALKVDQIAQHTWTAALATESHVTSVTDDPSEPDRASIPQEPPRRASKASTTTDTPRRPSRTKIRAMAANRNSFSPRVEGAKQIVSLMKAERDLLYIMLFVILLAGGGAGVTLFISVVYFDGSFFTRSWRSIEICNFFPVWGWSFASLLIMSLLVWNAAANLPPPLDLPAHLRTEKAEKAIPKLPNANPTFGQTFCLEFVHVDIPEPPKVAGAAA